MKKLSWIVAIIVVLVLTCLFLSSDENSSTKYAVLLPLTGSGADQGEWAKNGFELALREINQGRKEKIQLVYEDTKGDPKTAVLVYNKLKSTNNIPVIFTWGSGVGLALSPIVNSDHVIQMGIATAADSYSSPNDYTFRNFPSAKDESKFLVDVLLHKLGVTSVAILKINNDYGVSSAQALRQLYEEREGKVVAEEVFEPATTDFRTQLAKIKSINPPFIYLATYPKEGALLLRQARELGLRSKFIASVAISGGEDFFDVAGDSADGVLVSNSIPGPEDTSNPEVAKFAHLYRQEFGSESSQQQLYSARPYDALKIIALMSDTCGINTDCMRDVLFKIKNYQGASGNITFDQSGDIIATFNLQQIKDGRFIHYK